MARTRAIRLLSIVGTRPEAIKIAPLAIAASQRTGVSHSLFATGQHGAMFDDALADFGLRPDLRLAPLPHDPLPGVMTARLADALAPELAAERPDLVLVQGDTTSAYAGAIAAHRLGIPVGHVEAGLRSHDFGRPWPEERNRVMIDRLATLLFAPTADAAANLVTERAVVAGKTHVTGNSGIDALLAMRARLPAAVRSPFDPPLILLTCHRRESIGAGIEAICTAALRLADRGDVAMLCPVHSNPAVGEIVRRRLGSHRAITLTGGLRYRDSVAAMASARLILTDSGGIQEEAPSLGKPVLVMRDVTERPEAVAAGTVRLVGANRERIVAEVSDLLTDPGCYERMSRAHNPYGDGLAARRIIESLER